MARLLCGPVACVACGRRRAETLLAEVETAAVNYHLSQEPNAAMAYHDWTTYRVARHDDLDRARRALLDYAFGKEEA